ncbi:MAG: nuclear transport factor 2 family protein [Gammaproteobacteria bacterium]|nr:nuclear transport factor 2 family protein [Gammaproteobacteria bacterium]
MKNIRLALLLCGPFCFTAAIADEAIDRVAVVDMVQTFFDAMTDRDVDVMRTLLTTDGIVYGYRETADGLQITRSAHAALVAGIGERNNTLIERFWDPQILLHDRMAIVWTPYDFYVDGEFSHCGIDNFNFLKTDQGWKITGIVFSMEPDNCAESPLGPLQN